MFNVMAFDFLYEPERQLFSIGFRVEDSALDPNCYDLLASEARLASFIAIAKEDVPAKHWFRLGRTLAPIGRGSALISWSGSMFEYLMPSLVMREPAGSIIERTNELIVRRQIKYGIEMGVPWGISESQFNARDIEGTYQYSSFGAPDLGYKRGLGDNIVIAPYATALAAMVDPAAAAENFRRMGKEGACGRYGWYEALDYTPTRVPEGAKVGIVHAYMAHHQAMSIVAISNALTGGIMRRRFHAEPIIRATELLLQERMPRDIAVARPPAEKMPATERTEYLSPEIQRRYTSPHSQIPRTHILSNGDYAVMLTSAGSGYTRWRNIDVTRWREDSTCDNWGSYIYLRDTRSGEVWSAGYQPTGVEPDFYEVAFSESRAEFTRQDGTLKTTMEVAVSAEHDSDVRRICISNLGTRTREIELTSFAEIALATHADDSTHPAFAKLFVETDFVPGASVLLATRRRKSDAEPEIWAAHLATIEGDKSGTVQFETDRARFLGRGQSVRSPISVTEGWPLTNTTGCVLDPIFSLRCRVRVPRGETVRVSFWTLVAQTRQDVLDLADKHLEPTASERVNTLAWTHAQGQFHHLGIGPEEAHLFQRLASRIIFSDPTLRPPPEVLKKGGRNISALWAHGISGDLPIVLLRIDDIGELSIIRQVLRAFEYWRLKRLAVDIVILNERATSYQQDLQGAIDGLVRSAQARPKPGRDDLRGAVFVLRSDLISPDVRTLLYAVARIVLISRRGTMFEQVSRLEETRLPVLFQPAKPPSSIHAAPPSRVRPQLEFFNGLGGFAERGREYVTILDPGHCTPAPWINVIANPTFGFQVSADGAGFTWAQNSQRNRITAWSNDPTSDLPGEAIFLRDDDSGDLWSPTTAPIRVENASYTARHGQGYSRFENETHGIAVDLLQFVPLDDPVKISLLKIANTSRRTRNLSLTAYVEWVLGTVREFELVLHRDRDRRGNRCDVRAQSGEQRFRQPCCLCRPRWAPEQLDRRPRRVHRPQRHAQPAGRLAARHLALEPHRRRPRSLRRVANNDPAETRRYDRHRGSAGPGRECDQGSRGHREISHGRSQRRLRHGHAGSGTTSWTGFRSRRRTARSISWSIAGFPIRPWRAGSGRARGSTSRAGHMDSAISSRIRRRSASSIPRRREAICCAPPHASSRKATCSIGGFPIPAAACGHACRTTGSGSPMWPRTMSKRQATADVWTRWCRSWKARCCARASMTPSSSLACRMSAPRCSSIAPAASTARSRSARTACR